MMTSHKQQSSRKAHTWLLAGLIALVCSLTLGCASKVNLAELPPVDDKSGKTNTSTATLPTTPTGASGTEIKTVDTSTGQSQQTMTGLLAQRSVYFDLDSYVIKEEFRPVLLAHAKHLTANRAQKIALEGHTDESGGREYNLALGQKRANAVAQNLLALGVQDSQMEAVSFGKEKPKAQGNSEQANAENRRSDIAYK